MRLVDVAEFYSPTGGGVRSYIDRKFEAAAAAGHELFVLAPAAEDGFEPRPSGGVINVASPAMPFDANYRMFWRAAPIHRRLDELKPDLVEASSPWRGARIVATWRSRTPKSMFFHADPVAVYPQRWFSPALSHDRIDQLFGGFWAYLRSLAANFDSVIVGGDWLARRLERQGLTNAASVPMGIDRSLFSPALRDEAVRARLLADCGLPASARLFLGVGRFHAEKRWPMVIAAASAAGRRTPLGLVIVGDGMDRARVRKAAAASPHVYLAGAIRDRHALAAVLASADALVHGGDAETFGLVPAEALASGLPLVLPDRGGSAQLADPRYTESYRAGDAAAATTAIERLLARDPAALRAASVEAAAHVRADEAHFAQLFAHFADLAGARASRILRGGGPIGVDWAPEPAAL